MKKSRALRRRGLRARLGVAVFVLAAVLAVVGGAAHTLSAATTTISIDHSQNPGTTATLSTTGQTTYVFYSLTLTSQSSWTHVALSDGAPTVTPSGSGAAVVFVAGCPSTPTLSGGGFSCSISKLSPGTPLTISVVVQTPTGGTNLAVDPKLSGDENFNDQVGGKSDTFFTPLSWTLSSDTTSALTSYTNPAITTGKASFSTNKGLSLGNPQWTQSDVPNGLAPLGTSVSLAESAFATGDCPSFVATAGLKCFGQISTIGVGQSGPGGLFTCPAPNSFPSNCVNSLSFTVRTAGASLTSKINIKKAGVFHNGVKVPFCSTGTTDTNDGAGDCILTFTQDPTTHDITWSVLGGSNGNWGGFG